MRWTSVGCRPAAMRGTFPAYAAGSHEFVAVESGSLRLTIGDEGFDLAAGDS
ncbi:hypothetical protein [Saccharopolyspora sp. ASAGF58]|uniref:hypothetical protein n=1 Tax=Saccharopolyspora sp. ASAGF58 TaxID=2719023 RepID=UPI001FF0A3E6|nr:hypothetical protein [Saccharopolyspora sp. ASAGF58]